MIRGMFAPDHLRALVAAALCLLLGGAQAQMVKLDYPGYSGPKKRVAVAGFEDKSGFLSGINLGHGFTEMLTTALVKTNRFIVLERQALDDLVTEQNLVASGLANPETAPARGKVTGAQLIVRGAITEYQEGVETKQQAGGVNVGRMMGTFGVRTGSRSGDRVLRSTHAGGGTASSKAHMAIDLRVINAETGQVIHSESIVGQAGDKASGFDFGIAGISFGQSQSSSEPRQAAIRSCIYQAVQSILTGDDQTPWRTNVSQIADNGQIIVSAGADEQIRVGDNLVVESKGQAITDPETGEVLGTMGSTSAIITITDVQPRFSMAKLTAGKAGDIKRGDHARYATSSDFAKLSAGAAQAGLGASVTGQIVDAADAGVPGVRVAVPAYGITTETDAAGRFDLSGMGILGRQVVTFSKLDYKPRSKEVDFSSTSPVEVKLDLIAMGP
ncbi:carboxypeptidase regulatory-like domain-containing protein [bacterium]|nr:carboxypeptidase regulatory-like domain-containing protein [bacterium]